MTQMGPKTDILMVENCPDRLRSVLGMPYERREYRLPYRRLMAEIDRYRSLESAVCYGIFIHEDGIILESNDTLAAMLGHAPEEITGRDLMEFIPPKHRPLVKNALTRGPVESINYIEILKQDGTSLPVEARARAIRYRGRDARVNVLRELSGAARPENEETGPEHRDRLGRLLGRSLPMRRVYDRIVRAAASDEIAVIYGETGTGKELAARTIFELSLRSDFPFVTVNCGALQESLFESMFFGYTKGAFTGADRDIPGFFGSVRGGVLFLDEVGELTLTMQAKLLRALQDGEYTPVGASAARTADVRIISATNRNLAELVKSGRMRPDFFQRIHVIPIEMPPLRNHREDIGLLVDHFFELQNQNGQACPPGPPARLMTRFMTYDWPGNVRELFNELRRFLATGEIELGCGFSPGADLPEVPEGPSLSELMEAFERKVIAEALSRCDNNRTQAAKALSIPRKSLQRKIKRYDL